MSTYDLKITGGTIVDGTGGARYTGDVGIKDGVIVAVGRCDGSAQETLAADGALVTPGFTDLHTHYDGQVSWDPDMTPSSLHGVTTAIMGNCGVGFAPVRLSDHTRLIELMEGVEDIPGAALAEGIPWGWETFPEYMDRIDFPHTIDFCAQVTHDALRVYVMGERGVANSIATSDDIGAMRDLVRAAVKAGAVGFSTGRSDNHRSIRGEETPASEARIEELVGIAEGLKGLSHGVLQGVSDFDMAKSPELFDGEFDLLERMAEASGRPLSLSLIQRDHEPGQWRRVLKRVEAAVQRGLDMKVQVGARGIGLMLGLQATFHPFIGFPSYKKISQLPLEEQVRIMRDPAFKAQLLTEKNEPLSGDGSAIPPLADHLLARIDMIALRLFKLGEQPNYEPDPNTCLYVEGRKSGRGTLDVIYDALLEQEGRALLYFPLYNYIERNLNQVHEMLQHPLALPGLSDGGAHVGTVCDASFPTFMLTHWARDRKDGLPLEKVIKMQCHDTARFVGLRDRGLVAVGQRADLNVIDHARLALEHPRIQADLPAGGRRLMQGATGYIATLVRGEMIAREGKLTGARPGRLARVTA
ncbi:MAG: amidohydrolase family protein [Sandaracinaceae bacterium]|jgi:N-acyl-D-aspartate/D-glutamate deacylase|nr:amidohydrolase family protein [Sandaracinaceae bacterium]MBK8408884.1 amidohydrolase family protein [Sandaracinaceae bacterium]MBP7681566.1 amidohydrolase family protein [Deltaproteobacteria bacterium]